MDELLSEKEQIERLRQWWRENGWFLLGGVALGAALLFGWNQYQAYQDRQAEQAGQLYQSLKEAVDGASTDEATTLLARLRDEHPDSSYTDQAGLMIARQLLITSSPERAAEELRYVMDNTDERELSLIARLRLARVLAYRQEYDEALRVLSVDDRGEFAGRFNEVEGDIHVALGRTDAARTAYLTAMTAPGSEVLDRNFVQMKLNDLPRSAGASSESPPNDAPVDAVPATEAPAAEPETPATAPEEGA